MKSTSSVAKPRDPWVDAEVAALRKIARASIPRPPSAERAPHREPARPRLIRPGDTEAKAAIAELADVGAKRGSSRALTDQVAAAVELAVKREVSRDVGARPRRRRPTPKAAVKLERLAAQSSTELAREVARPRRSPAPRTTVDAKTMKRFTRVVDRQLKDTLGLSAPARARVVEAATGAMVQAIETSLAEAGVDLAAPSLRERHFVAALRSVLENAHASVARLAHGIRAKLAKADRPHDPEALTKGEKIADAVAHFGGSWKFILTALTTIGAWVTLNGLTGLSFDPYPFILLNLVLSVLAALQGPVILMSQNRQGERDRVQLEETHDASLGIADQVQALSANQAELTNLVKELLATREAPEGRAREP